MEKLKTTVLPTDDFQYITDYEAHAVGVKNYNDMILREGLKEERQRITYFYEGKIQRAEREKQRAEREKQALLTKQLHLVEKCLKRGDSLAEIEAFLEIDRKTLDAYIEQLDLSK